MYVWMVLGATGGVGFRVVQTLLQQGKAVRALARDEKKARTLLVSVLLCCWPVHAEAVCSDNFHFTTTLV